MNAISKEPARLHAEERRIQREIVSASVSQYPAFLAANRTNGILQRKMAKAQTAASKLTETLSVLQTRSNALIPVGQQWRVKKQQAGQALLDHSRILEVLEIPQTLETCVRHDMFHEALMVLEHAVLLSEQHGDIPLVRKLSDDVAATVEKLVNNLLMVKLSGPLTLSVAIKIVTFLKKLGLDEGELRVLFLEKRSKYIESLADELDDGLAPYLLVSKRMNILKVAVTEAVQQYNALFPATDSNATMCDLLSEWGVKQVDRFIDVLASTLPSIGGSELGMLAEHSAHCCHALAKVQLDIHVQATELITRRILDVCLNDLSSTRTTVKAAMASHAWKPVHAVGKRDTSAADEGDLLMPPLVLLPFLPLAYAVNGVIAAYNNIRRCAATAVARPLWAAVEELMGDIKEFILDANDKVSATEEAPFKAFVSAFVNECLPFVMKCISRLTCDAAPNKAIQAMLVEVEGIIVVEAQKAEETPPAEAPATETDPLVNDQVPVEEAKPDNL